MTRRACLFLAVLSAFVLCAQGFAVDHTEDTLETVRKNLEEKKAVLIDVREQAEWDAGHLAGARLVPLSALKAGGAPDDLPKDTILYGHCRSGNRVLKAAAILQKAGYDFRPLKQGYEELAASGFAKAEQKKEKEEGEKTEARKIEKSAKKEPPQEENPGAKAAEGDQGKQDDKPEKAEKTEEKEASVKDGEDEAGAAARQANELPPCCR